MSKDSIKQNSTKNSQRRSQRGYTLLEYCAGAAIIAGVIFTSLTTLSGSLSGLMNGVGSWAERRTAELNN